MEKPLFTNDAVVLGILITILALIFKTSNSKHPFWEKFYTYVPALLLCYFIPAILNSTGVISGETSGLYKMSSRYLLPASLVLLCVSIDFKSILSLGPKALLMFLSSTFSIIIGGPIALLIVGFFAPEIVAGTGDNEIWRGLATVAGSWIGGGANQTAMKEVFSPSDNLFSMMITVDVVVANIWMAFLLYGAGMYQKVDKWLQADNSSIEKLKTKVENYRLNIGKIPTITDTMMIAAVGFGGTAISHAFADVVAPFFKDNYPGLAKFSLTSEFFWIVVVATTFGLLLSFTKARTLEGVGASRIGSVLLYVLVATIGMHMNILAIFDNLGLFLLGIIWMLVHIIILIFIAKISKSPLFFVAVGSQANVGGAASAPIVASAFSPALAPVGVLLAVFGYALGTYGAWICAQLMRIVSGL
jgi:uncharacterized membrane protein